MRPPIRAAALLLGLFAATPVMAASCPLAAGLSGSCGATIGTGAVTVLSAKTTSGWRLMLVDNESTSATIACTDDGTTPAINAAGSYTIPPGGTRVWQASNVVFAGPMICLASAGSTPVTVKGQ